MQSFLTVGDSGARELEEFAVRHGLGFRHVRLSRGRQPSQPMLVVPGGAAAVREWTDRLARPWLRPMRVRTLTVAGAEDRDVEHHVALRSWPPRVADLLALTDLAASHGAGLCEDPRPLIVQRCADDGRARLDLFLAALFAAGHEVASVERWHVRHDSNPGWDTGWLTPGAPDLRKGGRDNLIRRGLSRFPPTFRPVPGRGVEQHFAFDPALKHLENAYRPGEPVFRDAAAGRRWRAARQRAMDDLLTVIGRSRWSRHLALRGSAVMTAWVGEAARRPGDLDFVVVPADVSSDGGAAREILDGIVAAADQAGLRAAETVESAIWTYERADGRRLVIPFSGFDVPDGAVQIDVVFGEALPIAPEPVALPGVGVRVLAATADLSLAWKLLWLATDRYPQGKDLYDAVLLAEHTTVDVELVRELMVPELGAEAGSFTAATPLTWRDVDWDNFADEYPGVPGTAEEWLRRLALALDRE